LLGKEDVEAASLVQWIVEVKEASSAGREIGLYRVEFCDFTAAVVHLLGLRQPYVALVERMMVLAVLVSAILVPVEVNVTIFNYDQMQLECSIPRLQEAL
jgi:hypothetical protein